MVSEKIVLIINRILIVLLMMYMHHSFVIILFSIFIVACGEAENEPQAPIVEEEVTYCDSLNTCL